MQFDSGMTMDMEKLKEIACSPVGKQLIDLFTRQNGALQDPSISSPSSENLAQLKMQVKEFLSTEEGKRLMKQLGETYGR